MTEPPSPKDAPGEVITDKGIDDYELVIEEATAAESQPSSGKDGAAERQPSSGQEGSNDYPDKSWATEWAEELTDKWDQDNAGQANPSPGWRVGYKPVQHDQSGMTKADASKLRHGWLNKFAVVIQAMDDNEWHLVKRYVDKLLGYIQSIVADFLKKKWYDL